MGLSEYLIVLQRPLIRTLRRVKLVWDLVLIVLSAFGSYALVTGGNVYGMDLESGEVLGLIGNVFLAAGALPFLLSLPLILAEISVGCAVKGQTARCFCFRDLTTFLAYTSYAVFIGVGVFLILYANSYEPNALNDGLAEIFAEVALIYTITTILGVPSVEEDETKSFLSRTESKQLERSGSLNAPYARFIDYAFRGLYHDALYYQYPDEIKHKHYNELRMMEIVNLNRKEVESKHHSVIAAELLNECANGWESAWFVSAIGYCDISTVGEELLSGLLTCLSGSSPFLDRFICQSAITSLGKLYSGTQNRKMSKKLFNLWKIHEISNVREHCYVSIQAIRSLKICDFVKQMNDLKTLSDPFASLAYFQEENVKTEALSVQSLREVTNHICPHSAESERTQALIAACCLLDNEQISASDFKTFLDAVQDNVIYDPLEGHLVKALALEAMVRATRASKKAGSWNTELMHDLWDIANELMSNSVYKSVRQAAERVLEESLFPYLYVYKCFGADAIKEFATDGFNHNTTEKVLFDNLPHDVFDKLLKEVEQLNHRSPLKALNAKFEEEEQRKDGGSYVPWEDPVLMMFCLLTFPSLTFEISDTFLQERLNSPSRRVRFATLVAIGQLQHLEGPGKLKKEVVPNVAQCELISDVRDLAVVLLSGIEDTGCCSCFKPEAQTDRQQALVQSELDSLKKAIENGIELKRLSTHNDRVPRKGPTIKRSDNNSEEKKEEVDEESEANKSGRLLLRAIDTKSSIGSYEMI